MELHILEHSLKVASIEKEGIQICTHGLIKLAFLASKTRCRMVAEMFGLKHTDVIKNMIACRPKPHPEQLLGLI